MKRLVKAEEGKCVCSWGTCSRLDPKSKQDLYEPVEPELEKHGLPWFYFIAGPENVADGSKAKYLQESKDWWSEKGDGK